MVQVKTAGISECVACRENGSTPLFEVLDHESGERFHLVRCSRCGLVWVSDPPHPQDLWRYYTSLMGQSMHRRPNPVFQQLRRVRLQHDFAPLASHVGTGSTLIDYGTGDGSLAVEMQRAGHKVGARDTYEDSEWSRSGVEYRKVDVANPTAADFSVGGEVAGGVIMRHVLEHVPDPSTLLKTIRDAGVGYVAAVVPNADSRFARRFGADWYYWDPPRHLFHFNHQSLMALAEQVGAGIVSIDHYGIDEVLSSINRRQRVRALATGHQPDETSLLLRLSHPTGIAAGLMSGLTGLVSKGVIRVLFKFD